MVCHAVRRTAPARRTRWIRHPDSSALVRCRKVGPSPLSGSAGRVVPAPYAAPAGSRSGLVGNCEDEVDTDNNGTPTLTRAGLPPTHSVD